MSWTLEKAKNAFSEVVRRALAGEPQVVVRGGREDEAVVVLAKAEYDRLTAPMEMLAFFRGSPLAEAVAAGDFGESDCADLFPRDKSGPRAIRFE